MNRLKQIFLITLFFGTTTVKAQRELDSSYTIYDYGMEVGAVLSSNNGILAGGLNFYAEHGRRKFMLGITLARYNSPNFRINGLQFYYEFDPYEKGRRFEFYFFYRFGFIYDKDKIYAAGSGSETTYEHAFSYLNSVGNGFRWNWSKRWYLNNSFGIGPQFVHTFAKFDTEPDQQYFRFGLGFNYLFNIGLRF